MKLFPVNFSHYNFVINVFCILHGLSERKKVVLHGFRYYFYIFIPDSKDYNQDDFFKKINSFLTQPFNVDSDWGEKVYFEIEQVEQKFTNFYHYNSSTEGKWYKVYVLQNWNWKKIIFNDFKREFPTVLTFETKLNILQRFMIDFGVNGSTWFELNKFELKDEEIIANVGDLVVLTSMENVVPGIKVRKKFF